MGELTLGIVFMVFLILFLSSDVGKEINDKINNSPEVRARRALEELERQQQQTINEQTKQTEAVKTQVINTMPQTKAEPQPVRKDPPQQKPTPKQQPKPKPKTRPEPVSVTEVQESMFPEAPLEKGDEVTALLDSDGIYYIDNRKTSGIIWIPYTPDSQASIDVIKDMFDVRFETRGAVITQGYPAWRVMIR